MSSETLITLEDLHDLPVKDRRIAEYVGDIGIDLADKFEQLRKLRALGDNDEKKTIERELISRAGSDTMWALVHDKFERHCATSLSAEDIACLILHRVRPELAKETPKNYIRKVRRTRRTPAERKYGKPEFKAAVHDGGGRGEGFSGEDIASEAAPVLNLLKAFEDLFVPKELHGQIGISNPDVVHEFSKFKLGPADGIRLRSTVSLVGHEEGRPPARLSASVEVSGSYWPNEANELLRMREMRNWVQQLLGGSISGAAGTATALRDMGFSLYISDDMERAKAYMRARYQGDERARYALLTSERPQSFQGVLNEHYLQRLRKRIRDAQNFAGSCCQLKRAANAYECQGMELDFVIVAWGEDFWWKGNQWQMRKSSTSKASDPAYFRTIDYKVLLTRGRDGCIIYLPPIERLKETSQLLLAAGCNSLPSD